MDGFVYNLPCSNPNPQFLENLVPLVNLSATSDESSQSAEDDEQKRRMKVLNRESARRSRMRKKQHLNELWSMLVHLIYENKCMVNEVIRASEVYENVVEENKKLREENSKSRKMIGEIGLHRFPNVEGNQMWTI